MRIRSLNLFASKVLVIPAVAYLKSTQVTMTITGTLLETYTDDFLIATFLRFTLVMTSKSENKNSPRSFLVPNADGILM